MFSPDRRCVICEHFATQRIYNVPEGEDLESFKLKVKVIQVMEEFRFALQAEIHPNCNLGLKNNGGCPWFKAGKAKDSIAYKYKGEVVT